MSHAYKPVQWNRTKLIYDAFLLSGIAIYLAIFMYAAPMLSPAVRLVEPPVYAMRAYGSCAFLLLTIILSIGPLARIDARFLPLLYNRRHFGVVTAVIAIVHADAVLGWYFSFAPVSKIEALFTSNTSFTQIIGFPFELFGVFSLCVLVLMAVTSHDFWLSFLTARVWKSLHMLVYAAYASVVLHIALGSLVGGGNPVTLAVVVTSLAGVITLHLIAGLRERRREQTFDVAPVQGGWVAFGDLADFTEGRALVGNGAGGERIAVFKFKGKLSALSNVCSHQGGPVGEGKVVLGLVTCPWHGYQYRLEDGCSPPPFKERIRKYRVRLEGSRIWVDPVALPLGTIVEPVPIPQTQTQTQVPS
jgi:nitrite reductase/ring-hydroxylating ferredoxin subunit/DMSO/TMAO reductase YedYZ heme-binding membrane subunit